MNLTVKGYRAEVLIKDDTGEIEELRDGEVLGAMGRIVGGISQNSHRKKKKIARIRG